MELETASHVFQKSKVLRSSHTHWVPYGPKIPKGQVALHPPWTASLMCKLLDVCEFMKMFMVLDMSRFSDAKNRMSFPSITGFKARLKSFDTEERIMPCSVLTRTYSDSPNLHNLYAAAFLSPCLRSFNSSVFDKRFLQLALSVSLREQKQTKSWASM